MKITQTLLSFTPSPSLSPCNIHTSGFTLSHPIWVESSVTISMKCQQTISLRDCNGSVCWRPTLLAWLIQLYFTIFRETELQINMALICHDLQNYTEKARIYGNTSINIILWKIPSHCGLSAQSVVQHSSRYNLTKYSHILSGKHWCIGFNLLRTGNPSTYFIPHNTVTLTAW